MIDGVLLGILTWLSMIFTFLHFPDRVKNFMLRHFLFTDLVCIGITFTFLSGISQSITSVIGSITCGLFINISLIVNKNLSQKDTNNTSKA